MKFSVYSLWTDPYFYLAAAGLGFGLFLLIYSIRRYLELANRSELEDEPSPVAEEPGTGAADEPQGELFQAQTGDPVYGESSPEGTYAEERADAGQQPGEPSPAETFVMGIYESLKSLDARMGKLEKGLGAGRISSEFTVKFLEDILSDYDSLDKEKIKARLEYLVSDLKGK